MQLVKLLTFAFLAAAGVSAAPTDEHKPKCPLKGQVYYDKKCQCPHGKVEYHDRGKCGYPPLHPPKCEHPKEPYCIKNKHKYSHYDPKNEYCENNGKNYVVCCKEHEIHKCIKDYKGYDDDSDDSDYDSD